MRDNSIECALSEKFSPRKRDQNIGFTTKERHFASQKKKIASKYFELNYKRNMLQLSVYDMYEDFVCSSTRNILRVEHKLYAFLNRLFCNSAVAVAAKQATDCLNCYFKLNVC